MYQAGPLLSLGSDETHSGQAMDRCRKNLADLAFSLVRCILMRTSTVVEEDIALIEAELFLRLCAATFEGVKLVDFEELIFQSLRTAHHGVGYRVTL